MSQEVGVFRWKGFLARVHFLTARERPIQRRYLFALAALFIVVLVVGLLGSSSGAFQSKTEAPYILAMSTALSGPQAEPGQDALQGVQLYLDSINRAGGVNGHQLHLQVFDDRDDPATAQQVARQAVASQSLLMLGPLYSNIALPTNPIYMSAHLPVISASVSNDSVTGSNPFFFRLSTTTTEEASISAIYATQVLGFHNADIIYADDLAYGMPTAKSFSSTFISTGGVTHMLRLAEAQTEHQQTLDTIVAALTHNRKPGIIFLAMLDADAHQVIIALRRHGITAPIMGTDSLGSDSFASSFASSPEEIQQPGYFSDGIYASSPLLYDSAPTAVQSFSNLYQQRYGNVPGWHAAKYYEAAQVAVAALKAATITGTSASRSSDRERIAEQLGTMNSLRTSVVGLDGPLYFDNNHNGVSIPIRFGQFSHGQFLSAPVQMVAINNPISADLSGEKSAVQSIIQVGKQSYWKQSVAYAGIDLKNVSSIDITHSTFTADFYFWVRYAGSEDATSIAFTNASSISFNPSAPIVSETIDGLNYRLYDVTGDFDVDFDFHDYPFDQQRLTISFQNTLLTSDRLVYAIDSQGLELNAKDSGDGTAVAAFQSLSSWKYRSTQYASNMFTNHSTLGNPEVFDTQTRTDYSGLAMTTTIQRNVLPYLVNHLLALAVLFLLVYASLYISNKHLSDRLVLVVTALLTSAVLLLSVNSELPDIGYVVSLSYIYYVFFILCLLNMVVSLLMEKMEDWGQHVLVRRTNILLHATYLGTVATLVIFYIVVYGNRFS